MHFLCYTPRVVPLVGENVQAEFQQPLSITLSHFIFEFSPIQIFTVVISRWHTLHAERDVARRYL